MRTLSKSKLLAFRQCPKRLWLEVHHPELRQDSAATEASFQVGHSVGEVARRLYDPAGQGVLIDVQKDGFERAFKRTKALLSGDQPIFEAGFSARGALAFADIMLPAKKFGSSAWRMVEVKSSASLKDYYREDTAIQSFVAREAGVSLASVALAHIDSRWVYPGGDDYQGLLVEHDVTREALDRHDDVQAWLAGAQATAALPAEPQIGTGPHCRTPFECGYLAYCQSQEPQAEYPVKWLPNVQTKRLKAHLAQPQVRDLRDVPDDLLNARQLRVKSHTISGQPFFDTDGASKALRPHGLPAFFLDFESVQFAVPIWAGTRPYQQIVFQFSLHRITTGGHMEQAGFIDLTGRDPSQRVAEALVRECGQQGAIFVYNASFEVTRMRELAQKLPAHRAALGSIIHRIVDLRPVAEKNFYHPSQQGSWSIKDLAPAIVSDLDYGKLDGIRDGGAASAAYLEAIHPQTTPERRNAIERQLLAYCGLDTYSLVKIWQRFTGRTELNL